MARRLRHGLNQALKSGSLESHATLELSLPSDIAPAVNLYLATARVTIDGVTYDWQLRETGAVKTSLTRAADRTTVDIQNADTLFGVDMLRVADTLYGASAKLGRYWRDLKSGAEFHHPLLTGVVAGVEINETVVRLTLVSDMYSTVNVGATEPVQRKCRFQTQGRFRGAECGYSGALLTCNGLLDSADGCDGRHGSTLKRAKFGGYVYIESANTISGAAALPVPAYNQAIRTAATDLGSYASPVVQQPFFAVNDETFNVTNDSTNEQTVITPKGIPTKLYNAVFDYGAVADGVTDTTTEIQAAIDAAEAAGGGTVFLQAGTYKVTGLTINGHVKLSGSSDGEVVIYSTSNAPIVDCGQTSFEFPPIENLKIRGSVSAGSSQIGLRVDDATYGLRATVRNVWIENCGGAGLYVGNAFSSFFENIFSTNCAGGNYVINSANMPVLTFRNCDSGTIHSSYRTGYHIKAGYVVMRDCNGIYGGSNPEWCVTIGRRIGLYGETAANGSAFVRFENCNFESSTSGGVQCLFNSRASFHACTWVGDGASSGSYKAVLYDACQINPTETTGSINSGSSTLTVASAVTWTIGQGIKVAGAGVAGADLTTTVSNISGTTFTLAANASTTVSGAVVSHTDDVFYPLSQSVLGVIDDDCGFSSSPASYYANSEPIHVTAYPITAGVIPPIATNGRGPKIAGDKFVSNFRNDTSSATWPLPRMDGFLPVQTITASTTFVAPGVRYIECNHSTPITITLYWPGWALNSSNEIIIIKDVSSAGAATNNITIQASNGGTVNGSTYVINADKGSVILVPHSADDYRVIATYSPGGGITGSGTSGQVAVWNGASSLTSDADLTFDGYNLTAGRTYHAGGTAGAPGVASSSDSGTGFYLSSAGVYGFASSAANGGAGGNVLLLKGDRVTLNGNCVSWDASETVHDFIGSGSPEGVVTASIGSVYRRTDGGTSTTLYVKESGTGNTGWVAAGAGGGASGADPTASVGLSTTNGVATTFMRSDAAPALSQAIAPTWTATHTFNSGRTPANVILLDIAALGSNGTRNSHTIIQRGRSRDSGTPHTIDWRTQTIVSSNAGASQYEISYEIDSGGYTAMLIIADDGSVTGGDFIGNVFTAGSGSVLDSVVNAASGYTVAGAAPSGEYLRGNGTEFVSSALNGGDLSAGSVTNAKLANSAITIAGTSTSLGGSISQDTITGLSSTGLVKRTGANTLTTATGGTDYEVPLTFSTGLTRSTNTITVNTTQNIAKLSNLTTNGVITTTGGDGTLVVDDNALDYLYSLSCS